MNRACAFYSESVDGDLILSKGVECGFISTRFIKPILCFPLLTSICLYTDRCGGRTNRII